MTMTVNDHHPEDRTITMTSSFLSSAKGGVFLIRWTRVIQLIVKKTMPRIASFSKCFTGFRSTEAFLEHRRTTALHITCEYQRLCQFGRASVTLLRSPLWMPILRGCCCLGNRSCSRPTMSGRSFLVPLLHFGAGFPDLEAHYRASHTTCPQCVNPLVFRYKEELREHCLREHFGCPWCKKATYSEDEEPLNNHIRLDHFSCHLCNYQTVLTVGRPSGTPAHRTWLL